MPNELYSFGPFVLDVTSKTLLRGDAIVPLTPKEFDTLRCLVENAGKVVSKEILTESVWPGQFFLADSNLAQHVKALRRKLGDNSAGNSLIRTAARQGYYLTVPVGVSPIKDPDPETQEAIAVRTPFLSQRQLFWSITVVFLAICAGVGYLAAGGGELRVTGYIALTNDGLPKRGPLLSDGHRLLFQEEMDGAWKVVSVPISGGEPSPLDIPLRIAMLLDIASDASALLLLSYEGSGTKLWSWPLAGGSPQVIPREGEDAGWAPDRARIAYGDNTSLILAASDGSRTVSVVSQFGRVRNPRWSPDGKRLSFTLLDPKNQVSSLWQTDVRAKKPERMALTSSSGDDQANGTWTADGRSFLYEGGSIQRHDLWLIPGADRPLTPYVRKSLRLTNGPLSWTWPVPSKSGRHVFALGESLRGDLARLDPRSGIWHSYLGGIPAYEIDFSRDGRWMAYTRFPDHTIWKARTDGSERVQLTQAMFEAHQAHWSPDGSKIAFIARKPGKAWRIMKLDVSKGTLEEPIPEGDDQGVPTWSADGHSLVFGDWRYTNNAMAIHVFDERTRRVSAMPGSGDLWTPRWSPDGVYISALRPKGDALLLAHCCSLEWKTILEGKTLDDPMWSSDSKYIFLIGKVGSARTKLLQLHIPDGKIDEIADVQDFTGTNEQWFGVAPDGSALGLRGVRMQEIYALECKLP